MRATCINRSSTICATLLLFLSTECGTDRTGQVKQSRPWWRSIQNVSVYRCSHPPRSPSAMRAFMATIQALKSKSTTATRPAVDVYAPTNAIPPSSVMTLCLRCSHSIFMLDRSAFARAAAPVSPTPFSRRYSTRSIRLAAKPSATPTAPASPRSARLSCTLRSTALCRSSAPTAVPPPAPRVFPLSASVCNAGCCCSALHTAVLPAASRPFSAISNICSVVLTRRESPSALAPSSPIALCAKCSACRHPLTFSASASACAPCAPMWFFSRCRIARHVLTLRERPISTQPASLTVLSPMFNVVSVLSIARSSANFFAPAAPMPLPLRYNSNIARDAGRWQRSASSSAAAPPSPTALSLTRSTARVRAPPTAAARRRAPEVPISRLDRFHSTAFTSKLNFARNSATSGASVLLLPYGLNMSWPKSRRISSPRLSIHTDCDISTGSSTSISDPRVSCLRASQSRRCCAATCCTSVMCRWATSSVSALRTADDAVPATTASSASRSASASPASPVLPTCDTQALFAGCGGAGSSITAIGATSVVMSS
eukprot:m.1335411 g.1335411  ORF g.1335411 m.1335411 type:complete len:544 (+) comp24879_c1_seq20:2300-3931(+)